MAVCNVKTLRFFSLAGGLQARPAAEAHAAPRAEGEPFPRMAEHPIFHLKKLMKLEYG